MVSPPPSHVIARLPRRIAARVFDWIGARVRIDTRSLALFRFALGLLIVADVLLRSRNLEFFYTDSGAVPASLAVAVEPVAAYSPYAVVTSPTGVAALFALTGLVGVALALGYYTRPVTVLALVLVVSLDARNPFVLSFADVLFATLLALAVFLPLGERWSLDAVAADRHRSRFVGGIGSAIILSQMVVMYVVNGYHKTTSALWRSGEAAVLILGIDEVTHLFGDALRAVPELLQLGGVVWLTMLCAAWLLLVLRGRPRHLLVAAFAVAHVAMALTVRVGAFSFVGLAGLLLFCQSSAWDDAGRLGSRVRRSVERRTGGRTRSRLTSMRSRRGLPDADAARSRLAAAAGRIPRPVSAEPSRRFNEVRSRLPAPLASHAGAVVLVAIVATALVVAGGLSAVGVLDEETPGDEIETAASGLVAFQSDWSIFAPNPRTTDRYYVFPARTERGELIDAHADRSLSFDRPKDRLQRQHATYRERFYTSSLRGDDGALVAEHLGASLCETYRTAEGESITHIEFYVVEESITRATIDDPDGRERSVSRLHRHGCGDAEPIEIASPSVD